MLKEEQKLKSRLKDTQERLLAIDKELRLCQVENVELKEKLAKIEDRVIKGKKVK